MNSCYTIPVSGVPTDISYAVTENNLLAVGTYTGTIDIVNTDDKKAVVSKVCGQARDEISIPQVLTFSIDGKDRLITGFDDRTVVMYDVERGLKKISMFQNPSLGSVANSILVINDHVFAIGGVDGDVRTYDKRVGRDAAMEINVGTEQISQMILSPDKNSILCAMGDGQLGTIKIRGGAVSQSETYETAFNCLGTFRDNTKLAVGADDGRIYTFDMGKFGYHSDMFKPHNCPINAMIPITEKIGILGHEDGTIRAYNLFPNKLVGVIGRHSLMVEQMDISSDGRTLATTAHEEEVRFWDVGFLEDVESTQNNGKKEVGKVKPKEDLPSSNKQNSSDFFSGL